MLKSLIYCTISISLLVSPGIGHAQWTRTNGPYGGYIVCAATDPLDTSIIAIGTDLGGMYISTDGGVTWTQRNNIDGSPNVAALAFCGTNLLLSQPMNGGFFRSTDYGANWISSNVGIANAQVTCLSVGDSLIFAGTYSGVYVSSDSGASWTSASNGLGPGMVQCILTSGSRVFAGIWGGSLYASSDNGVSWSVVTGLPNSYVTCLAAKDSTVFAEMNGGGLYATTDQGANWSEVAGLSGSSMASVDSVIIFGGEGLVYRSTDGGTNWAQIDSGLGIYTVTTIVSAGTKLFAGEAISGLWTSLDGGLSWAQVPITVPVVSSLAVKDTTVYAGTKDGGLFVSENDVTKWNTLDGQYPGDMSIECLYFNSPDLYVGTSTMGVYLTTDGGADWTQPTQSTNGFTSSIVFAIATDGSDMFLGSGNGVFRSTDNGADWTLLNNGIPSYGIPCVIADSSSVLAATGNGVYRSTDQGATWSNTLNEIHYYESVARNGRSVLMGAYPGKFFVSEDDGLHWKELDNGLPHVFMYSLAILDTVVIAGTSDGIFVSPNNGSGWTRSGLAGTAVYSLGMNDTDIFAGTNDGVLRALFSSLNKSVLSSPAAAGPDSGYVTQGDSVDLGWAGVTGAAFYRLQVAYDSDFVDLYMDSSSIVQTAMHLINLVHDTSYYWRVSAWDSLGASAWSGTREFSVPKLTGVESARGPVRSFALYQCYPNPFNPTTTISYQLPLTSRVSLKIYDVLGREVATLVGEKQVAGAYKTIFNASGLASGVYFCRLEAGNYRETKKLLLLK